MLETVRINGELVVLGTNRAMELILERFKPLADPKPYLRRERGCTGKETLWRTLLQRLRVVRSLPKLAEVPYQYTYFYRNSKTGETSPIVPGIHFGRDEE